MINSVAARPVITGIIMSMVTTSGWSSAQSSMAWRPSAASATTSIPWSAESTAQRCFRTVTESSITSTRIFGITSAHEGSDPIEKMSLIELALHNVGPGADLFAVATIFVRAARRDQYRRYGSQRFICARSLDERKAVHTRHFNVDQEQSVIRQARL